MLKGDGAKLKIKHIVFSIGIEKFSFPSLEWMNVEG